MSSKEFLDQMRKAGEEHSEDQTFLTVAKMRIQFGYSGMLKGERPANFFKPYSNSNDAGRVADEVTARLKEAGSQRAAIFAISFSIPEETNTGELVTWDIEQITFTKKDKESEYQILFNAISEGDFPIGEWFWGSYQNQVVGEYEKEGVTKKRYLSLPVEKFADEAAAHAAVSISGSGMANKWSAVLLKNYPDPDVFNKNVGDIVAAWGKIENNEPPWTGAPELPVPPMPPTPSKMEKHADALKQYLADLFDCAPADIEIVLKKQ